jgi:hypothetical protein
MIAMKSLTTITMEILLFFKIESPLYKDNAWTLLTYLNIVLLPCKSFYFLKLKVLYNNNNNNNLFLSSRVNSQARHLIGV